MIDCSNCGETLADDTTECPNCGRDLTRSDSPYDNNHFDPKFRATVHVHIETSSSDCDGPLYRSSTWTPEDDQSSAEFFAKWMLSLHAYNGTVEVHVTADGEWVGTHSQRTDEGYHAEEHRSCIYEDCRGQRASQRDIYAEQMGY